MGSPRVGRCLKSFLEVARFTVTKYGVVGSHGELTRCRNDGFGRISLCTQKVFYCLPRRGLSCVHRRVVSSACTEEISAVYTKEISMKMKSLLCGQKKRSLLPVSTKLLKGRRPMPGWKPMRHPKIFSDFYVLFFGPEKPFFGF